jgi:hypothetical protein
MSAEKLQEDEFLTEEDLWEWRYHPDALTNELSDRLQILTQICGRAPLERKERQEPKERE